MRRLRKQLVAAMAVLLFTTGCTDVSSEARPTTRAPGTTRVTVLPSTPGTPRPTVTAVVDGRTVQLSDGTTLRIKGLAEPGACWAAAATAFAKALLLDKPVRVTPEAESSPLFFAEDTEYALLAVGQGVLRSDAPNDPAFRDAEAAAWKAGLGLWGPPCKGLATTTAPPPPPSTTTPPKAAPARTTTPPAAAPGCTVAYRITHQWPDGFRTDVTIANKEPTAITGWTLRWTFAQGQTVTQMWNAAPAQSGTKVSATNLSYSATIPAGGSTLIGFTASQRGGNPIPGDFTLNGRPCSSV